MLAGIFTAACLLALGEGALKLWPAYAAAAPTKSFSIAMLFARLGLGAGIVMLAGFLATTAGKGDRQLGWWIGIFLCAVSTPLHLVQWSDYPVWYHLTYLSYLIPIAGLGGWLAANRVRESRSLPNSG